MYCNLRPPDVALVVLRLNYEVHTKFEDRPSPLCQIRYFGIKMLWLNNEWCLKSRPNFALFDHHKSYGRVGENAEYDDLVHLTAELLVCIRLGVW